MGPNKIVLVQIEGDRPPSDEETNDVGVIEVGRLLSKGLQASGAETDDSSRGPGFAIRGAWNSIRFMIHAIRDPEARGIIAMVEVQKKKSSWFGKKGEDESVQLSTLCNTVHAILSNVGERVKSIRWFSSDQWNTERDGEGTPTP